MAGAFSLLRANDTRDKVETRPAIPNARLSGRPQLRAQPHRHRCRVEVDVFQGQQRVDRHRPAQPHPGREPDRQ